jgi:hypothetical protein
MRVLWLVLGLDCLATFAFGDVSMTLTGPPPGPSMAGVYTSPYTADIDGVSTYVICDDFTTDSYQGLSWMATVTTVAALPSSTVKFDTGSPATQEQDYATAAYLAGEILAQNQNTSAGQYQAGVLSYALWGVFDTTLLTTYQGSSCTTLHSYGCLTSGELTDATNALTTARANAGTYAQYSNVNVYTPTPLTASQEFLTVSTPEPSAPALLAVYLLGLLSVVLVFRRRISVD